MLAAMEAIQGKARPDDNSVVPPIDRLAVLPQAMIMSMAEKGQIPKDMVMPILGRKAENAEAAAQIKAAAQQMAQQQQMGGPPPSTVFEKVMAQNAAREAAPMTRENTGIANVPMQKQMFAGKRAGGIVAFAGGGQPKFYPGMPGIQRGQDAIEERKRKLLEAEIEANKRGETIFKPRKNPGFIDFLGGESPITTPSLPPGQAYYPGIPGLMRGQEAAKKSLDSINFAKEQIVRDYDFKFQTFFSYRGVYVQNKFS